MAATPNIYTQKFPTITTQNYIASNNVTCFIDFRKQSRKLALIVGNSSSSDTASAIDTDETSPVEIPPSIISALNVEKALLGIAITDINHYGILGLSRKCSYAEVPVAYKKKIEEITNEGLVEEELNKKLQLLKESYSILSTPEERRLYDWSLVRSEAPDDYKWPFEVDPTPPSTGTPPPQEPEDVEPTILVGYFFLGWFVLAAVLSISLNL
ncbi:NAD(P)H-quinone oxidoreductase subunit U, chloroplastic [Solanum lycopersicum]|uniref:J domain-containing protein n=1 Tax=Solanum lycopersicum TaxID=4081 RepID=A0A3Q7H4M0_SOLLC|nr:NAD(P)H-quinone oxidoreductase subunit U, chloroplastic [Solanum lycopersicum]